MGFVLHVHIRQNLEFLFLLRGPPIPLLKTVSRISNWPFHASKKKCKKHLHVHGKKQLLTFHVKMLRLNHIRKDKEIQALIDNAVFVVASHYQGLQNIGSALTSMSVRANIFNAEIETNVIQQTLPSQENRNVILMTLFPFGTVKEIKWIVEHIPPNNKIHVRNIRDRNNLPGYSGVQRREKHRKIHPRYRNSLQANGNLLIYPF